MSLLSLHSSIPPLSSSRFRSRFNNLYTHTNFYSAVRDYSRGQSNMADFTQTKADEDRSQGACSSYRQHGSLHLNYRRNPDQSWGCTSYEQAGATIPGVSKAFDSYTGRVIYENNEAKTIGSISIKAPTPSAFNTDVNTIVATTALNTAMGGTPSHDNS